MNLSGVRLAIWLLASTDDWANDDAANRRIDQLAHAGADLLFAYVTEADRFYYDTAIAGIDKEDRLTRICKLAKDRNIMVQPWVFPNGPIDRSHYPRGVGGGYISGTDLDRDGRPCATWVKNTEVGPIAARDILDHHDIDGIHLDVVRYRDNPYTLTHPCQCNACRVMYRRHIGRQTITAEDLKTPGVMICGKSKLGILARLRPGTSQPSLPAEGGASGDQGMADFPPEADPPEAGTVTT